MNALIFGFYRLSFFMSFCLCLGLMACNRQSVTTPTAVTPTPPPATLTATRTPAPTATRTPAPSPTPILPMVAAASQPLTDNGRLTISTVTALEPGWLVIHAVRNGTVAEVLGYTAVPPGTVQDVTVTIDPLQATDVMTAILHEDSGRVGEFEFPGIDEPVQHLSAVVSSQFTVQLQVSLPEITVADQEILEDGVLRVGGVFALADGWLLVQADAAGQPGGVLGFSAVAAGQNDEVVVVIPWREATPLLHVVLYQDNGRSHLLDIPGEDVPVLVSGQVVAATFRATLPPDVLIFDQPMVNETVVIDRVINNGPGWAAILADNGGQPGLIIGFAPLVDGLNEQVVVAVQESAVTNPLYVQIHQDVDPVGEFDFPRSDPALSYQGRLVVPTPFRLNAGNYLLTQDQSLSENGVLVPVAVVEAAGWLVIYTDVDGELGEIVGAALLTAGVNRHVQVVIETTQTTAILHAVLHLDAGEIGTFEYPDGPDVPFRRNSAVIQAPFVLLDE